MIDLDSLGDDFELWAVRIQPDTHMSNSSETPGASRMLLRADGTNGLRGPPEGIRLDRDSLQRAKPSKSPATGRPGWTRGLGEEVIATVAAVTVEVLFCEAVVPLFRDVVAPAARRKREELRRRRRPPVATPESGVALAVVDPDPVGTEVAVTESTVDMTAAEYWERLALIAAAERFVASQRGLLATARITDDDLPEELAGGIRTALQSGDPLLDAPQIQAAVEYLAAQPVRLRETEPKSIALPDQPAESDRIGGQDDGDGSNEEDSDINRP